MALKPCKECGKEISTEAKTCPNCGKKNPTQQTSFAAVGCLAILGLGMMMSVFGGGGGGGGGTTANTAPPPPSPREVALRQVKLDYTWSKGGFDNVMLVNLTFTNPTDRPVKDIEVTCTHYAPSGTEIDRNTRTVFEVVPAKGKKVVKEFNMGLIHSQAESSACAITDLQLGP